MKTLSYSIVHAIARGLLLPVMFPLLAICCLAMNAEGQDDLNKKITLQVSNKELKAVLIDIEKQASVNFFYNDVYIQPYRKVSLHVTNKRLADVLADLLTPLNISYHVEKNSRIFLDRKEDTSAISGSVVQAPVPVKGMIRDNKGLPLKGVTVRVKGAGISVLSDEDGAYAINVPDTGGVLIFSFVGYGSQEVPAGAGKTINIVLNAATVSLNDVVVIGYGSVQRKDLTGAVATIKGSDIASLPVNNLSEVLQGRVAGLDAVSGSYAPGEDVTIRVRGNRSLRASNDPLLIVDGIPMQSMNDINTSDVQSIDVLKDASATAIYGSRAANGVIIITTKRGKSGKTSVAYATYYGIQRPTRTLDIMNGARYAELRRNAFRNPAQPGSRYTSDVPDYNLDKQFFGPELGYGETMWESVEKGWEQANGVWTYHPEKVRSFDWEDFVLRQGNISNHQVNINGGNDKTRIALTFGYNKNVGIVKGQDFRRYNIRINIDHNISKTFKIGTSSFYSNSLQNLGAGGLYKLATQISPLVLPYDDKGEPVYQPMVGDVKISPRVNPYFSLANVDEKKIDRLSLNVYAEALFLKDFKYRINVSTTPSWQRRGNFLSGESNERVADGTSKVTLTNTATASLLMENIVTYNKQIRESHFLNLTFLYSLQADRNEGQTATANTLPYTSQLFNNLGTAANVEMIGSSLTKNRLMSYMGRANYSWKDRYLLTVTGRWDGASVLAEGNKWQFFPSAALAWKIEEENFMKQVKFIEQLKLRVGYGITGNSSINPYETLGSLQRTPYVLTSASGEVPVYGFETSIMPNPDLKWETTAQTNIGLDFSFLKGRVSGSVDLYQQSTTNLLMNRQITAVNGFTSVIDNVGATKNKGIEINLQTENIKTSNFQWTSSFLFTKNKESIEKLYNTSAGNDIGNGWFIGYPIKTHFDYKVLGIWGDPRIPQEEWSKMKNDPSTKEGNARTLDFNNNGVRDPGDRVIIGSEVPDWQGSVMNTFSFRGIDLSILVFARMGQTVASNAYDINQRISLNSRENSLNVNYWTPGNPTGSYPYPYELQANPKPESGFRYFDGSFIRIKNVSLGYTFPKQLLHNLYIASARIYITAQNAWLFTNYPGADPEGLISGESVNTSTGVRNASSNYNPSAKTFTVGLNVNF
ncbi:TonB-dependent receptor [Chitinophaga sp. RCC_12]|uniref:TonB-dependent receptor n=1 Tax=Chitinophaga sp. RCC_12 TaxID=3239226 RepID=UPI0035251A73